MVQREDFFGCKIYHYSFIKFIADNETNAYFLEEKMPGLCLKFRVTNQCGEYYKAYINLDDSILLFEQLHF